MTFESMWQRVRNSSEVKNRTAQRGQLRTARQLTNDGTGVELAGTSDKPDAYLRATLTSHVSFSNDESMEGRRIVHFVTNAAPSSSAMTVPSIWRSLTASRFCVEWVRSMASGARALALKPRSAKGPITLLNLSQTGEGKLRMIANQAEAIESPTLKIGKTMTHVKFTQGPTQVMNQWFALAPTHHAAMRVGHNTSDARRVATLIGIPFDVVSPRPE